jgi:hypothetical protein
MQYTERDLTIAERSVAALEKFITEQQRRFAAVDWEPAQREELDRLLKQFEDTLRVQRELYHEIWIALHPAPDVENESLHFSGRRQNGASSD